MAATLVHLVPVVAHTHSFHAFPTTSVVQRGPFPITNDNSGEDEEFDYKAAYKIQCASNNRQRKRKRDEPSKSVQSLGRGIRKLAALYGDVSRIIADAQEYERDPYEEDHGIDEFAEDVTDDDLKWLEEKRRQVFAERNYEAYVQINRLIPNLTRKIAEMELTDTADYFTLIQKGANDARSEDLRRVTAFIGNAINQDRDRPELAVFDHTPSIEGFDDKGQFVVIKQQAPFLHASDRSTRGLPHDLCGGLSTTTDKDWENSKRVDLRSGAVDLGANYFLRIFYDRFHGDPNQVEVGYLKSRYLVKSYKAVFTAPSSAEGDDDENTAPLKKKAKVQKVRKPIAEMLGMKGKVTPRSIAYIVILVYFAVTNASVWTAEYYGISFPQMYDFIVDFFEAPAAGTAARKRADDLLTWWHKQIFPAHAASAATHQTSIASRSQLRAQRAALELALMDD
ncbi:hypothetical protein DFH09DRAFT_1353912 [Mycena vulgaris]|nr:hypothetical protein DFH09DRAFT_1353912 [Mycena vulgaris]